MTRYLTDWYAATDLAEAQRLAKIDGCKQISTMPDVSVLHCTGSWALWSDGHITTSIGLPESVRGARHLSDDAVNLISSCCGSDSGRPDVGWALLIRVARLAEQTLLAQGGARGVYASLRVSRLSLELTDGTKDTIYEITEGYPEGYGYELVRELPATIADDVGAPERWLEQEAAFRASREGES